MGSKFITVISPDSLFSYLAQEFSLCFLIKLYQIPTMKYQL